MARTKNSPLMLFVVFVAVIAMLAITMTFHAPYSYQQTGTNPDGSPIYGPDEEQNNTPEYSEYQHEQVESYQFTQIMFWGAGIFLLGMMIFAAIKATGFTRFGRNLFRRI